jgi:hypothetical protein|tara:strand:- start:416 stop:1297 length:882 start_codon:yes stop_codon:yes gene_type:complete
MAKKKKTLDTLVSDIYKKIGVLSKGKQIKITNKELDEFGDAMKDALKHWASPPKRDNSLTKGLRMSNIGKPDRQLWYDLNSPKRKETELEPSVYIKFLYGHLLEVLMLFFVRLSGHTVTSEQKEVKVSGISGHMDCVIDGEVVDVKTASGYSFKKFKDGSLAEDDSFGYLAQLAGYEEAEQTSNGGFLVLNKETGQITLFRPEELDKPNIKERIKTIKQVVKRKKPPEFCFDPVPEGKAGNLKLARKCFYCPHKFECHKGANDGKGLRAFQYSKGITYLTHVVKEPKVEEILV